MVWHLHSRWAYELRRSEPLRNRHVGLLLQRGKPVLRRCEVVERLLHHSLIDRRILPTPPKHGGPIDAEMCSALAPRMPCNPKGYEPQMLGGQLLQSAAQRCIWCVSQCQFTSMDSWRA